MGLVTMSQSRTLFLSDAERRHAAVTHASVKRANDAGNQLHAYNPDRSLESEMPIKFFSFRFRFLSLSFALS